MLNCPQLTERNDMHGYYWGLPRLDKLLLSFAGAQFTIETPDRLTMRGEVAKFEIPDMKRRRILVSFKWLCERRIVFDNHWNRVPRWTLVDIPAMSHQFDLEYTVYYPQRGGERIKLWTKLGEVWHFYQTSDYTTLVQQDDEFVQKWKLPEFAMKRRIVLALLTK